MRVVIDTRDMKRLEKTLETYAKKGLPHATRNALNAAAFEARKEWAGSLGQHMTLRNSYTARSIQYEKATGTNMDGMLSKVGSRADYMVTQEQGATKVKKGKHGVAIPTSSAAGQGEKARPRTRPVRRSNYLSAIHVASRISGRRSRRNAVAVVMARKSGGVAYLDLGRRKGLFRVTGTKRGLRVRMLYDLSNASVRVPKNPTMHKAVEALRPRLPAMYVKALEDQLRRAKAPGF